MQARITSRPLDSIDPFVLLLLRREVIDATLVWENKHKRMQDHAVVCELLELLFEEYASQAFHLLMLQIRLILVAVEFLAKQDKPVLFQLASPLLLFENFALIMY